MLNILVFIFAGTLFSQHQKGSFVIEFGANAGYLPMLRDINAKIDTEGAGIIDFIPEASNIFMNYDFNFSLAYSFSTRFRLALYTNYIMLSKSISESFSSLTEVYTGNGKTNALYYEFSTGVNAVGLGLISNLFLVSTHSFVFSLNLGLLYYPSFSFYQDSTYANSSNDEASLNSNLYSLDGSAKTWGVLAGFSAAYYMTRYFAIAFNFGYNYVAVPSLEDANGTIIDFAYLDGSTRSSMAEPLGIDISNVYAGISLRFEFGGKDFVKEQTVSKESEKKEESVSSAVDSNGNSVIAEIGTQSETETVRAAIDIEELKNLKSKVSKYYRRAKRKRRYKQKRAFGRIYRYIKKTMKRWKHLSYEEQLYYIQKIEKKIRRAKKVRR